METRDELQVPKLFLEIQKTLEERGWTVVIDPARSAWRRAHLEAEHDSGARVLIRARRSSLRGDQTAAWKGHNSRYFVVPAVQPGEWRAPWYRLDQTEFYRFLSTLQVPGVHLRRMVRLAGKIAS